MPIKSDNELAILEAIDRLSAGEPTRASDTRLVDRNLIAESGVAKATLYRCSAAMDRWRKVKEDAVQGAIVALRDRQRSKPGTSLEDADLLQEAQIDSAALHRMPDPILAAWQDLKLNVPRKPRRRLSQADPDAIITSLVAKLYACSLAIRQRDEIIAAQNRELERLGSNIIPLPVSSDGAS